VKLTAAGEALLDRTRPILREVDAAVTAAQSIGGEMAARMARVWEPFILAVAADDGIEEVRSAYESVHAQFAPPPEIDVRAVTARGVPSLVVGQTPTDPPSLLYCTVADTCSAPRSATARMRAPSLSPLAPRRWSRTTDWRPNIPTQRPSKTPSARTAGCSIGERQPAT